MNRRLFAVAACSLVVGTLAVGTLSGCKTLTDLASGMTKPTASVTGVRFGDFSADGLTLVFQTEVKNPYEVDLPLTNLEYGLASGGAKFLSGSAPVQGTVPAKGSKTVKLPAKVSFAPLLAAVSGVKPGAVVPYAADMKLSVNVPQIAGGGTLALPISKSGELPVPAVPDVSVAGITINEVGLNSKATLKLNVKNTNQFAVNLAKMGFNLDLAGTQVSTVNASNALSLTPGQSGTLDIPVSLSLSNLGLSAFNALRGRDAGYRVHGSVDMGTPFGPLTLPLDKGGTTKVSS